MVVAPVPTGSQSIQSLTLRGDDARNLQLWTDSERCASLLGDFNALDDALIVPLANRSLHKYPRHRGHENSLENRGPTDSRSYG